MSNAGKAAGSQAPLKGPRATAHFTRTKTSHKWLLIDAKGHSVGRLATKIAMLLRGKHKPEFTVHDDVGDFVVVINAKDVLFRGNDKVNKKVYYKHTGYAGNTKKRTAQEMLDRSPTEVLRLAVSGMMPRGSLSTSMLKKLKIYAGEEHPHSAQQPEVLAISTSLGSNRPRV